MNTVDLEKLFGDYLQKKVVSDERYRNEEALEDDMGRLFDEWAAAPDEKLSGKSPSEYVEELSARGELKDYIWNVIDAGLSVSPLLDDAVRKEGDAVTFLINLILEKKKAAEEYAMPLITDIGGEEAEDFCIKVLADKDADDYLSAWAYDFLATAGERAADKILAVIKDADAQTQEIYADILSNYRGNKEIYYWLVTLLYRGENVPLFADLLAKYDNPAAIEVLKAFAEQFDINYLEFKELRYAVERLGGEWTLEKDFSGDALYRYEHPEE